jgi:hypothetical protein
MQKLPFLGSFEYFIICSSYLTDVNLRFDQLSYAPCILRIYL